MKVLSILITVFAWWFIMTSSHNVEVAGPFLSQTACERVKDATKKFSVYTLELSPCISDISDKEEKAIDKNSEKK